MWSARQQNTGIFDCTGTYANLAGPASGLIVLNKVLNARAERPKNDDFALSAR